MFGTYSSPLVRRYASHDLAELFSPLSYARAWRRVWLALAEAEHALGAPVTAAQVAALRSTIDQIDLGRVAEIEAETRHDVMAHLRAWGEVCPEAKPIIHLGATSQFVNDNAEALLFREGLFKVRNRLVNLIRSLSKFAQRERARPTLGYTHFQVAQLVTVGKRACLWIADLTTDLADLSQRVEEMVCRGAKGTTGTQASYLELLGSGEKVRELDARIAQSLGFARAAPVTGQTLSRKQDARMLDLLAGIAVSLGKMGRDVRLLMHTGELREPFRSKQVGSSAMPYKRNPMLAERLCGLTRLVIHQRAAITDMAISQWLERSLDDSATRRIAIPEAFLAIDGSLRVAQEIAAGVTVDQPTVEARVARHLPFMAVEGILAEVVKAGGDRQDAHERLRDHAIACYADERENFGDRVVADAELGIDAATLKGLLVPSRLCGLAAEQVDDFLSEIVRPLLAKHRDVPAVADALAV